VPLIIHIDFVPEVRLIKELPKVNYSRISKRKKPASLG
jgi:hypothetical protein